MEVLMNLFNRLPKELKYKSQLIGKGLLYSFKKVKHNN